MASLQIATNALFVQANGIAVYPSVAALALEQTRFAVGTTVCVQSPFQFLIAQTTLPANGQYVASCTAVAAYGGLVTYWMPLSLGNAVFGLTGIGQCRAVGTNLTTLLAAAYTGSTTGTLTQATATAIGAQDGVTLAVGDLVLVPGATVGTTAGKLVNACDAGPWVVSVIGTSAVRGVLTRPYWWQPSTALTGQTISITEGTVFAGTDWKSFAVKGSLTDVTAVDPALYPKSVSQVVTLVTGYVTVTNVPIFSTSLVGVSFQPNNFNGGGSTVSYRTGAYSSGGAATASGPLQISSQNVGTASVSITALIAAGSYNTSDVGTGILTVSNW